MISIIHNRNCLYQTAYHVIWCPKYRKDILIDEIAAATGIMIESLCAEQRWPILSKEIQPDHIHLFLSIPPTRAVADAIKILKGSIARKLFAQFPELKTRVKKTNLWSPSYYVGTAGNISASTIRMYIERSDHMKKRR